MDTVQLPLILKFVYCDTHWCN